MKCALKLEKEERVACLLMQIYADLRVTEGAAPAQINARFCIHLFLGPNLIYDCHSAAKASEPKACTFMPFSLFEICSHTLLKQRHCV